MDDAIYSATKCSTLRRLLLSKLLAFHMWFCNSVTELQHFPLFYTTPMTLF